MAKREGGSSAARPKRKGPAAPKVKAGNLKAAAKAAATRTKQAAEEVKLSNYRPPSQKDADVFETWRAKIVRQGKVVDALMLDVRTERGAYAELFAAAAEAGVPKDRLRVLRKTIAEEKRDPGERIAEAREMAWQAQVIKSPMVQLGLFDGVMKAPSVAEWEVMGYADGNKGITANPPGKPGSPEHAHYSNGHARGQKELAEKTFPEVKKPTPPAGGGGGFPPAGDPPKKLEVISP